MSEPARLELRKKLVHIRGSWRWAKGKSSENQEEACSQEAVVEQNRT